MNPKTSPLTPRLRERISRRIHLDLHQTMETLEPIHRGYSPALRLRARMANGGGAFIKCATSPATAEWLQREQHVYTHLHAPCMARLLAWDAGSADPEEPPFLVLEDLSAAHWPPPWTALQIDQVVAMLSDLSTYQIPGLQPIDEENLIGRGWQSVAKNPGPFLSLHMATMRWLDQALPTLLAVDLVSAVRGDALVHRDVRSDNLCFVNGRVVLVDWNLACLGNPRLDLGSWLPSLEMEGGPAPDAILPDGAAYAVLMSGFFAYRAGLPVIPEAPRVREVQRQQLRSALPWAVRALSLPPLDGRSF